jgi:hypothetical protein
MHTAKTISTVSKKCCTAILQTNVIDEIETVYRHSQRGTDAAESGCWDFFLILAERRRRDRGAGIRIFFNEIVES